MRSGRFWLCFNVALAAFQVFVAAVWIDLIAGSMGIGAESNGVYSYFTQGSLFKITVDTSKHETYFLTFWPGVIAVVVFAGVVISSIKLWNKTPTR